MPELLGFLQASAGEDYGTRILLHFALLFLPVLLPLFIGAIWGAVRLIRGSHVERNAKGEDAGGWQVPFAIVLLVIAFGIGTCYLSFIPLFLR